MTAPVDVLRPYARDTGAFRVNNKGAAELADALAAVAELIEADRDYDKAKAEYESAASRLEAWPALESAKARRAAAIARVQGGEA